ncbi:MAG: sigma-70 family RNA polymerase sigma factor [Ruminiclostridium sp.]|nr:sigma-70 family RNA polymerase sigma factor [Ruminiclostridium sp.]MBQ8825466.1 sigma-70 family RNA polymerase sigma factor [Oscillospiraceae bacterium]
MEDSTIIELYWKRNEKAIEETDKKYGAYCFAIANNILANKEDSDECVNDTWLRTWNVIPPKRPDKFRLFLGKITRNLSFDKYKKSNAAKRRGEMSVILGELSECVSGGNTTDDTVDMKLLGEAISRYLMTASERDRGIFIRRYFYAESMNVISAAYGITANNASAALSRTRQRLRQYLEKEGFEL